MACSSSEGEYMYCGVQTYADRSNIQIAGYSGHWKTLLFHNIGNNWYCDQLLLFITIFSIKYEKN